MLIFSSKILIFLETKLADKLLMELTLLSTLGEMSTIKMGGLSQKPLLIIEYESGISVETDTFDPLGNEIILNNKPWKTTWINPFN